MIDAFTASFRLLDAGQPVLPLVATSALPEMTGPPIAPIAIIMLCVVAAVSTWLVLPSKRENSVRAIGGVILLAVGLVFTGLLVRWTVDLGGMSVYFWAFAAIAVFASFKVITHTKPVYSALYFVLTVFATGGLFVLLWAEFMAAALVLIYAGAILITYVFVIMLASEATGGAIVGTGGGTAGSTAAATGAGSAGGNTAGTAGSGPVDFVPAHDAISRDPFLASLTGFAVAGLLIFVIFDVSHGRAETGGRMEMAAPVTPASTTTVGPAKPPTIDVAAMASTQALGEELIDNQAINVQLAGVILTLAMVGAITLARRRIIVSDPHPGIVDTLITPGTPVDDNPHSIPVYGTTNPRQKEYPEN